MAKRKSNRRSTKKSNSFTIFFIVVIIIAIISFVISYFVMHNETIVVDNKNNVEEVETVKDVSQEKMTIDGTWASYNDGAMLTINGGNFTIELPNVEGTIVASGKVKIIDNSITFIYTSDNSQCSTKPGVYNFEILENDEIVFKNMSDSCRSRIDQIVATWFKV